MCPKSEGAHAEEAALQAELTPVGDQREQTELEDLDGVDGVDELRVVHAGIAVATAHCESTRECKNKDEPDAEVHGRHREGGVHKEADARVVPRHEAEPAESAAEAVHVS